MDPVRNRLQEKEASRPCMNGTICMPSGGEGIVTSTFEGVHPVAKHTLTGERSLLPLLALCHYMKVLVYLPATF